MGNINNPSRIRRTNGRGLCCCCVATILTLLALLQSSAATFNPMYNPLQQHQSYYYHDNEQDGHYDNHDPNDSHQHYQQHQHQQYHHPQWDETDSIRGGSTMTISEPHPLDMASSSSLPHGTTTTSAAEPFHPPKILLKHMSMALRLTCEWNRRLLAGVNRTFQRFGHKRSINNRIRNDGHHASSVQNQQHQQQQGEWELTAAAGASPESYESGRPVNIHPDRTWSPPIREGGPDLEQESLTIFHATEPRPMMMDASSESSSSKDTNAEHSDTEDTAATASASDESATVSEEPVKDALTKQPRGVAFWGPELLPYLEQVTELLEIDSNGLEIALAMMYLDRACSVDTIRSNGCPPCPFCTPRTVHRLSLVALILAKQAVNGTGSNNHHKTIQQYIEDLEPLEIPLDQLELMANWMLNALGDNGSFVTIGQMKVWSENWEAMFFPKQYKAKIEQRRKDEQQRLLLQEQHRLMQQQQQKYYRQEQHYQYQQGYYSHQDQQLQRQQQFYQ